MQTIARLMDAAGEYPDLTWNGAGQYVTKKVGTGDNKPIQWGIPSLALNLAPSTALDGFTMNGKRR